MASRFFLAGAFCALMVAVTDSWAGATGYYNLPSSFCQCVGWGCGAGYHAPLILGPITWRDCCNHNEVRLPYPATPPYGCGHCGHCDGEFAAPTIMDPAPMPQPAPVVPQSRRHRPLFLR